MDDNTQKIQKLYKDKEQKKKEEEEEAMLIKLYKVSETITNKLLTGCDT